MDLLYCMEAHSHQCDGCDFFKVIKLETFSEKFSKSLASQHNKFSQNND